MSHPYQTFNNVPAGFYSFIFTTQARFAQTIRISDSSGVLVYVKSYNPTHSPKLQIAATGTFEVRKESDLKVELFHGEHNDPSDVIGNKSVLDKGGVTKVESFVVSGEDKVDQDYNDSIVTITWVRSRK